MQAYYWLAKPGIIYGNAITAVAGFLLAASIKNGFEPSVFTALLVGMSLVIACGCVINNYIDRGIDAKMSRTKHRPSVTGLISTPSGIIYGITLGIVGFAVLALYTNLLTTGIGAVGLFFYLVMYSFWKRRSVWGTVVGSVSGATPIVAGYTAVSNHLDGGALILFLIMVTWQMPHFYAIAIYRFDDYKAAGLPVLPVKRGMLAAKRQIVAYIIAFIAACAALTVFGYTGFVYLLAMLSAGVWWLKLGLQGFKAHDDRLWARRLFLRSLIVITVLSFAVAGGGFLP